jgi:hypothetical protein
MPLREAPGGKGQAIIGSGVLVMIRVPLHNRVTGLLFGSDPKTSTCEKW